MGIKIIGLDNTIKKYKGIEKKLGDNKKLLDEVGSTAKAIITQRTLAGKDVDGNSFKDYSPLYKRTRSKKGRAMTVNLTFTGRMVAAIKHKIIGATKVMLHISRAEESAKAYYNTLKGRKWFGLSRDELHKINEKIVKPYLKKLCK